VTQIAILSADDRLVEALQSTGLPAARIDAATLASYGTTAQAPHVLVADLRGRDHFPASLTQFRRQHPGVGIVLVLSSLDPKLMLEGMRAGVSECLAEPVTAKALDEAVRRLLTSVTPEPAGHVFALVGAKGGVGTTTLAVNTATALAKVSKGSGVLLVDLHVGHGDDAVFMGVEPRFSVLDALEHIQKVDESFFAGIVEKAEGGVHLLASPARPRPGAIEPKRVRALLDSAAKMYRTTVLDVPRSDMAVLDSLDSVTSLVVVASQEIASLRNAARMADMLRQRYGPPRVKVVINRFERDAAIAHADVERVVGGEVKHLIPSDYRVAVEALNAGRPIVLDGESRLAAALTGFARELAGIAKERAAKPAGMLGRLAWRRA
jgi:pilus assembly protein CpaE